MATTEPGISAPPSPSASPSEVGRHLRSVRKAKGLSRAEVARSAGLTRRELAAYERGKAPVPDSDLWCLAGSCGVDVSDLLPTRDRLTVASDLGALTVGESVRRLRAGTDGILREYLAMIYELRNLPHGARPPMREEDLATLADALGGTPDAIEARLHELIGAPREEAARLRSMILPPRSLAMAPAAAPLPDLIGFEVPHAPPAPVAPPMALGFAAATAAAPMAAPLTAPLPSTMGHEGAAMYADSTLPSYPTPTFDFAVAAASIGDAAAADRFFEGPRGDDPFASPPEPLAPLAPPVSLAPPAPPAEGFAPAPPLNAFDPFAGPTAAAIDPFAPPTGPPLALAGPTTQSGERGPGAGTFAAPPFEPPPFEPTDLESSRPGTDAVLGSDDPFATDDPFAAMGAMGAMDMVILGSPGSGVADPVGSDPQPELDADDPFAALRVPIPDASWEPENGLLDPASGGGDVAPGAAEGEPNALADPFADAFTIPEGLELMATELVEPEDLAGPLAPDEPPTAFAALDMADVIDLPPATDLDPTPLESTPLESLELDTAPLDDEPTDEWFDRAAAAADALIAGQYHDAPSADGTETPELRPIAWSLTPAAAAAMPTDPPAIEEPAGDVFRAAGSDWEVGGIFPATSMADDGTLALRRADVRWALADVVAAHDFTARATVNFTSGAGFGILFRASTDDSERITGYSFDVDPSYAGGGFLIRQWNDSRQHWKPLAHSPVADSSRLYGTHLLELSLRNDTLVASIDGETVVTVAQLSRASIDAGHEPCRGARLGVQAWSTTEVTVDRLLVASH